MAYLKTILSKEDCLRFDKFLSKYYPHLSYHLIQKCVREKKIRINGKKADLKRVLALKDILAFYHPCFLENVEKKKPPVLSKVWEKKLLSYILYEDAHLLVLNKPFDLATQGGSGQKISLDDLLKSFAASQKSIFRLVHRLDKPTTGVLLIAKNLMTAQRLSQAFERKQVVKKYWAIVKGIVPKDKGSICEPIAFEEKLLQAKTSYRVLERYPLKNCSFLEVYPETGRKHQIRIHLSKMGFPVLGDPVYGACDGLARKLKLHCRFMSVDGKDFTAPEPEDFFDCC